MSTEVTRVKGRHTWSRNRMHNIKSKVDNITEEFPVELKVKSIVIGIYQGLGNRTRSEGKDVQLVQILKYLLLR